MTAFRQTTVTFASGRIVALPVEHRDDDLGRKASEKEAFDWIARPDVTHVTTRTVTRYPGGRKGTYR